MSNPTPPFNGHTPPKVVVNHAFNIKMAITPIQLDLFRAGPTALMVDTATKLANGLGQIEDSPKYEVFLRAARKHGIKLHLVIAVEEPAVIE